MDSYIFTHLVDGLLRLVLGGVLFAVMFVAAMYVGGSCMALIYTAIRKVEGRNTKPVLVEAVTGRQIFERNAIKGGK